MLIRIGCGTFSKGMIGQIYQEYQFCAESVPVPVKQDDAITRKRKKRKNWEWAAGTTNTTNIVE